MKHRWTAVLVALVVAMAVPGLAAAQESALTNGERGPGYGLGENAPNPFSRETSIPFVLGNPPACADSARMYRVTMQIYNVLAQPVAVPILTGGEASGQPVVNLTLPCGTYMASWDGADQSTAEQLPTGVYLVHLQVDGGRPRVRRMLKLVR